MRRTPGVPTVPLAKLILPWHLRDGKAPGRQGPALGASCFAVFFCLSRSPFISILRCVSPRRRSVVPVALYPKARKKVATAMQCPSQHRMAKTKSIEGPSTVYRRPIVCVMSALPRDKRQKTGDDGAHDMHGVVLEVMVVTSYPYRISKLFLFSSLPHS